MNSSKVSLESPILVKTWKGFRKTSPIEILYAKADHQGIKISFIDGTEEDSPMTLSYLADQLHLFNFYRIHRKYLVNICYILSYSNINDTIIIKYLNLNLEVPVSRRNKKTFLEIWFKTCPVIT